jgi:MFS family permease
LALGEAPRAPVRASTLQWRALATLWTDARVRSSVLGYFGHMWELYTVWVLMPLILATRLSGVQLSWAAFLILGSGALGCVIGGYAARRWGSARVAGLQLSVSGLCCLLAPWLMSAPTPAFYGWLLLWGITVAGDSPQFSTLTARNAPPQAVGSVLTLTNSLGFAISIVSILLFVALTAHLPLGWLLTGLALGPALGLWALWPLMREGA